MTNKDRIDEYLVSDRKDGSVALSGPVDRGNRNQTEVRDLDAARTHVLPILARNKGEAVLRALVTEINRDKHDLNR
jgi:hypothetical protein